MRYRLRTLLILLLILPPLIAFFWPRPPRAAVFATVPAGTTAEVDLIQIDEFYDTQMRLNFKHILFWSRYPNGELHIREWRLLGTRNMKSFQIKRLGDSEYECRWTEKSGVERRVWSPAIRESKSIEDLELKDRKKLPKPMRQPLWQ